MACTVHERIADQTPIFSADGDTLAADAALLVLQVDRLTELLVVGVGTLDRDIQVFETRLELVEGLHGGRGGARRGRPEPHLACRDDVSEDRGYATIVPRVAGARALAAVLAEVIVDAGGQNDVIRPTQVGRNVRVHPLE